MHTHRKSALVRVIRIGVMAAATLALGACGGSSTSGSSTSGSSTAGGTTSGSSGSELKAAVLLPGSRDDQSWNSYGYAGLQAIKAETGAQTAFAENVADADEVNALRTFANQGYNLIFGHTDRFQTSMMDVAGDFPDTTFIAVAGTKGNGSNVDSIDIAREQFAYVEGYLAAKMTKSKVVGVVSGLEGLPVTVATVGGFRLGVEAVDPSIKTRVVYLSDMEDSAAAKQAVQALASNGADVVLPFLNGGVTGAVEGAKDRDIFVFGRSVANTEAAPKQVLTNVVEDWSQIYLATAKLYKSGALKGDFQGFGYDTESSGTTGGQLEYTEKEEVNPVVPDSVQQGMKDVQQQIAAGSLTIEPTASDARASG